MDIFGNMLDDAAPRENEKMCFFHRNASAGQPQWEINEEILLPVV